MKEITSQGNSYYGEVKLSLGINRKAGNLPFTNKTKQNKTKKKEKLIILWLLFTAFDNMYRRDESRKE
jgi:hypothetical protein